MKSNQLYRDEEEKRMLEAEARYDPRQEACKQVGGDHYSKHDIQPLDIIDEYGLDYYRGNAIKYILRNKMDPYEDIEKAIHYLEMWLDRNSHLGEVTDDDIEIAFGDRAKHYETTGEFGTDLEIQNWLRRVS